MQGKHYVTVGMLLTSLALMVASLDHWGDAIKPQFVAGLMTAVGTVLKAMYEDKPTNGGGSVSNGTRAAIGVAVLLAGALAFSGCALTGSSRHKAVVGSTSLYTAIAGIDDVEMGLFTAGQISPAQHATLNPRIVTLLKAGKAANTAVAAWPQGSRAPAELLAAVQELGAVAQEVSSLLPDGPTKSKLQTSIIVAQQAIAIVLSLSSTGGSVEQENDSAVRADWGSVVTDWRRDDRRGRAPRSAVYA
jgi:hypothetical protein